MQLISVEVLASRHDWIPTYAIMGMYKVANCTFELIKRVSIGFSP